MQVINLTPQQKSLKGLINSEYVFVICDTSTSGFVVDGPLGSGSTVREIKFKNAGANEMVLMFDYSSQLFVSTGNVNLKTIYPDECFIMINDTKSGLWYQVNNPSIYS